MINEGFGCEEPLSFALAQGVTKVIRNVIVGAEAKGKEGCRDKAGSLLLSQSCNQLSVDAAKQSDLVIEIEPRELKQIDRMNVHTKE